MIRLLSKIWCCSVNVTGILGEKELQVLLLRVQPYLRVNMWTRNHIVAACRMFVTVGPIKQSSLPHKSSIAQQYEIWSTNHKVKSLSPIGSIWSFFFRACLSHSLNNNTDLSPRSRIYLSFFIDCVTLKTLSQHGKS